MPYFNSYQQSYSPYPQQSFNQSYAQPQQMQTPINASSTGIIWVQGEIGARAYPVQAGNSVLLMDSEGQNFFIKSADMSGMPSMKKYSYSEIVDEPKRLESHDNSEYDTAKMASREEVKKLQEEITDLKNQIATLEIDARNRQNKQNGGKQNG